MKSVLFSAGLGDVIRIIYKTASYKFLSETDSKVAVLVASHNPFAIEISKHHRNASNFILFELGHKFEEFRCAGLKGEITKALLEFVGLSHDSLVRGKSEGYVPVFDAPDNISSKGHIVFCPFAGSVGTRTMSPEFIQQVVEVLRKLPRKVYLISRSFPRCAPNGRIIHGNEDARIFEGGNIEVVDNLTVPASLNLVRNCYAYIGSWSSLHQAAWFENKPVAVFYPTNWCDVVNRTGYAFGIDRLDCFHCDFASADMDALEEWSRRQACEFATVQSTGS